MLPSHRNAMRAITQCRTPALGGHIYCCPQCDTTHYLYHSCRNRHCPQCQQEAGQQWLAKQAEMLLPVPYFLLTFTLPSELRPLARSHQKQLYNLLFRASAAATQELALDPRLLGGHIGMIGVLHTWGRDMSYHPHVHYLVPAGALSLVNNLWIRSHNNYFLPTKPLAILFRAKLRDGLKQCDLFSEVAPDIWSKDWVIHCKAVGRAVSALKYLAPYIFRVAITNNRILKLDHAQVTFRYRKSDTGQTRFLTLSAEAFIHRFLQHVLPKGFVKVRYYGFFSPGKRDTLATIRLFLAETIHSPSSIEVVSLDAKPILSCPVCHHPLHRLGSLSPKPHWQPP